MSRLKNPVKGGGQRKNPLEPVAFSCGIMYNKKNLWIPKQEEDLK